MGISDELAKIGSLLDSIQKIDVVRQEIKKVAGDKKIMVIGGKYAGCHAPRSAEFDVVIVHDDPVITGTLARRIKATMRDAEVEVIPGTVNNVLGLRWKKMAGRS